MKRALIIVDLQNDFVSGSLKVKDAETIIPTINQLLQLPFDVKVATKDWHPKEHESFYPNHPGKKMGDTLSSGQILWPTHCVQNSFGAEFVNLLNTAQIEEVFYKGLNPQVDSYSTFFDNDFHTSTGLHDYLQKREIKEIYLAGLATDYCVKYSSLDGKFLGYDTYVIKDGCKAVNIDPQDEFKSLKEMEEAGIHVVSLKNVMERF